jgi:hypothetical protein
MQGQHGERLRTVRPDSRYGPQVSVPDDCPPQGLPCPYSRVLAPAVVVARGILTVVRRRLSLETVTSDPCYLHTDLPRRIRQLRSPVRDTLGSFCTPIAPEDCFTQLTNNVRYGTHCIISPERGRDGGRRHQGWRRWCALCQTLTRSMRGVL